MCLHVCITYTHMSHMFICLFMTIIVLKSYKIDNGIHERDLSTRGWKGLEEMMGGKVV